MGLLRGYLNGGAVVGAEEQVADLLDLILEAGVAENTEIAVTMTFTNLTFDSDRSTADYIFRADMVDADACEGSGMGKGRYMYQVDEDPEVRTGTISASCAPGDYTVKVSMSSPGNVELASATADFAVTAPSQQQRRQRRGRNHRHPGGERRRSYLRGQARRRG